MRELTPNEYRRCCLLVEQYRSVKRMRDSRIADRYMAENLSYKAKYGKWPLPPINDSSIDIENAKAELEMVGHDVRVSKRRKSYGISDRVAGYLTIEMAIANMGFGKDFEGFLMRSRLGSINTDRQCYKESKNYTKLEEMFHHLLQSQVYTKSPIR